MNTKIICIVITMFAISAFAGPLHTEISTTAAPGTPVVLTAHQAVTILNLLQNAGTSGDSYLAIQKATGTVNVYAALQGGTNPYDNSLNAPQGIVVVGPATLTLHPSATATLLFSYKIQGN